MLLLHLLLACTGPGTYCDGTTSVVYDPLASTTLDAWPDDVFSEDDRDKLKEDVQELIKKYEVAAGEAAVFGR